MNFLQQSNINIPNAWEVKSVFNKVKSIVLNYTEMETKVHEATNNEVWGASSTLMQEIAQGTFNYQYFNEIMPTIYKRFSEKEASQWRQIYKALVLLEYLVKNGSERVVDDARSHLSMIKMMRNFHYIDEKGKDQGINVRNRAKEIAELLVDTERIKSERKKAKVNRNKYTGVSSTGISSSARFGGFGSDSMYSGGSYGGGFEEQSKYDDDEDGHSSTYNTSTNDASTEITFKEPDQPAAKEANLLDIDEFTAGGSGSGSGNHDDWGDFTSGASAADPSGQTDDFSDFQSAAPTGSQQKTGNANLFDLLGSIEDAPASSSMYTPTPPMQSPTWMGAPQSLTQKQPASSPTLSLSSNTTPSVEKKTSGAGSIWGDSSLIASLDTLGKTDKSKGSNIGPSMDSMKQASINWNTSASSSKPSAGSNSKTDPIFGDLLS